MRRSTSTAGSHYDYLHLIGDAFHRHDLRARIFPLVLMPSAFVEGLGGGRPARLNAGRALLDLFRLVDDQNAQIASTSWTGRGSAVRHGEGVPVTARRGRRLPAALFKADRPRGALATAASAITRLRDVDLDDHGSRLAWSQVQLARILIDLGSASDAAAPLREALDIYDRLPSLSHRDSDTISQAR